VILNVSALVGDDGLIQSFLINFKFLPRYSKYLLAEVEDLVVGHIEDDEGIRKDTLTLHGQALDPRPWIS
jgi:hypothetical protein